MSDEEDRASPEESLGSGEEEDRAKSLAAKVRSILEESKARAKQRPNSDLVLQEEGKEGMDGVEPSGVAWASRNDVLGRLSERVRRLQKEGEQETEIASLGEEVGGKEGDEFRLSEVPRRSRAADFLNPIVVGDVMEAGLEDVEMPIPAESPRLPEDLDRGPDEKEAAEAEMEGGVSRGSVEQEVQVAGGGDSGGRSEGPLVPVEPKKAIPPEEVIGGDVKSGRQVEPEARTMQTPVRPGHPGEGQEALAAEASTIGLALSKMKEAALPRDKKRETVSESESPVVKQGESGMKKDIEAQVEPLFGRLFPGAGSAAGGSSANPSTSTAKSDLPASGTIEGQDRSKLMQLVRERKEKETIEEQASDGASPAGEGAAGPRSEELTVKETEKQVNSEDEDLVSYFFLPAEKEEESQLSSPVQADEATEQAARDEAGGGALLSEGVDFKATSEVSSESDSASGMGSWAEEKNSGDRSAFASGSGFFPDSRSKSAVTADGERPGLEAREPISFLSSAAGEVAGPELPQEKEREQQEATAADLSVEEQGSRQLSDIHAPGSEQLTEPPGDEAQGGLSQSDSGLAKADTKGQFPGRFFLLLLVAVVVGCLGYVAYRKWINQGPAGDRSTFFRGELRCRRKTMQDLKREHRFPQQTSRFRGT